MLSYQNNSVNLKFPIEMESFRRIQTLSPMNTKDEFNMTTDLFEESYQEQSRDLFFYQ